MLSVILNMGTMGLVNSVILLVMTVFALRNAWRLYITGTQADLSRLGRSINIMLFWGGIVIILGFIETFSSMKSVVDSIVMSGTTDIRVMVGGVLMLLPLLIYSFTAFLIILFVWHLFSNRHRKLLERTMKEAYAQKG